MRTELTVQGGIDVWLRLRPIHPLHRLLSSGRLVRYTLTLQKTSSGNAKKRMKQGRAELFLDRSL
ncbi:MAG: hypothetical protein JXA30_03080, partial [Deltaproteobacteria bacterium]|nr:hypothetical protein [Deltaproteobacteria bacterium]